MFKQSENKKYLRLLIVILLLTASTRIFLISSNPGYYGDECCYAEVGYNLVHGKLQYEAIKPTFFSTFMTQPPLFPLIAGILSLLFGKSILIVRLISSIASIFTAIFLYRLGIELKSERAGLIAVLLFTIHPRTLMINRYGFTYNLGMMFTASMLFFALRYLNRRKIKDLLMTCIIGGLNLVTVYYSITLIIWLFLFIILIDIKRLYFSVISLLPFIFLLSSLFLYDKESLIFDIRNLVTMASGESGSLKYLPLSYIRLFTIDPFLFIPLIGLFFNGLEKKKSYLLTSFFLMSSVEILRQRIDVFQLFYPAVFFIPVLHLYSGLLIDHLGCFLSEKLKKPDENQSLSKDRLVNISILAFLCIFSFYYFIIDINGIVKKFDYPINKLSAQNTKDINKVADYIEKNCKPESYILTSIPVGFLLNCPHASLIQAAAYAGYRTVFFDYNVQKTRFCFDLSIDRVRYLVIIGVDREWTLNLPGVEEIMSNIKKARWELVFRSGEVEVYSNPYFH
jgi:4-amino-4-deoxy-L-arabinose transferase-like glycosyltransferase